MAKSHIESVFMSVKIMHQLAVLSIKEINANGKLAVAAESSHQREYCC